MDKPGYAANRIFYWGMEITSMIVSALSLFFDFKGILPNVPWQIIAIFSAILFILFAFRHIVFLEGDLFSKISKVMIAKYLYLESVRMDSGKPIIISSRGETATHNISRFLKISFANAPKHNTENNHAKRLTAKLTYRDENGKIIVGPIYARWSESDQPKRREDIKEKELIYRNLDSGGKPGPIDIAFKIDSEDVCYAYNNDSYFASDLKVIDYQIRERSVNVNIELTGERVKRKYTVGFYNDGAGMPIRIKEKKSLKGLLKQDRN